jgi:hypothetical protein
MKVYHEPDKVSKQKDYLRDNMPDGTMARRGRAIPEIASSLRSSQ